MQELGREFLDKRLEIGVSQQHVAQSVGISRSTYSRTENALVGTCRSSLLRRSRRCSVWTSWCASIPVRARYEMGHTTGA